jgi:hypothetical protein
MKILYVVTCMVVIIAGFVIIMDRFDAMQVREMMFAVPSTRPDPPPVQSSELSELSYDHYINSPAWVAQCETKLERRIKVLEWEKQTAKIAQTRAKMGERLARAKTALDTSRAGGRCEIPPP